MAHVARTTLTHITAFEDTITIEGDVVVDGELYNTAEHEVAIGAAAFQFDANNSNTNTLSAAGYRTGVSGASLAIAPLDFLKVGDRITYAQVFYNPNGGGTMEPKLGRIQLSTGTITYPWDGATDSTGTAIESQNSGALTHDVAAGYAYFLENLHSGAANRTHGAVLRFTRPAP